MDRLRDVNVSLHTAYVWANNDLHIFVPSDLDLKIAPQGHIKENLTIK